MSVSKLLTASQTHEPRNPPERGLSELCGWNSTLKKWHKWRRVGSRNTLSLNLWFSVKCFIVCSDTFCFKAVQKKKGHGMVIRLWTYLMCLVSSSLSAGDLEMTPGKGLFVPNPQVNFTGDPKSLLGVTCWTLAYYHPLSDWNKTLTTKTIWKVCINTPDVSFSHGSKDLLSWDHLH